ncbi:MAG TPA: LysE/ArgO family amino acid transporter [Flexivirga sp.]|uniref:LysE/ArgO family amino acid transporter n=1 Tax=Flexivirga sp. TaxID=1962927 RepID=UPI002CDEDC8C|nr:LysE/ArgO family amino acid transporter [Flexivirga sp.]HWC20730.1 LysE/ArgO family amino acid transporter [Flexivirga sp.]
MLSALLTGLFTGLSLIVAIGAQNAFVLRQGLSREHIGTVILICIAGDVLLITAGVAGVGAVIQSHPAVLTVCRWLGAAYLVWFGIRSLLAARHPSTLGTGTPAARGSVAVVALTITFLNPHVYLDTVLMLGNIANQQGTTARWWFAVGACLGSIAWFTVIGYGARYAARWMSRPGTWRVLDVLVGLTMLTVALLLVLG